MTYYFLGIGGIGMSAIARYLTCCGHRVCGYDLTPSPLTAELEKEGMEISYTDDPALLPDDIALCIYTPAVPKDTNLYQAIAGRGIKIAKRAEVLGEITKGKHCIAVAGSHGKTTTSGLITHLLHHGGVGCSAFLGGISNNLGSNLLSEPDAQYIVVEADEYDRSFLHLHPTLSVITATDPDHLDIYGTHACMMDAFAQYASQTADDGMLLVKNNASLLQHHPAALCRAAQLQYSGTDSHADYYAANINIANGEISFDLHTPQTVVRKLRLCNTATYNIENAVAACAIVLRCGLDENRLRSGLETFAGMRRRFEYHIKNDRLIYIDDYAHHPQEISAALQSVRQLYPGHKVTGIFQPHLYSRTADLQKEFAEVLSTLDEAILLPIYPAREKPMPGIDSQLILRQMTNAHRELCSKAELIDRLKTKQLDILVTMGAGDIDRLVPQIATMLRSQQTNQ